MSEIGTESELPFTRRAVPSGMQLEAAPKAVRRSNERVIVLEMYTIIDRQDWEMDKINIG